MNRISTFVWFQYATMSVECFILKWWVRNKSQQKLRASFPGGSLQSRGRDVSISQQPGGDKGRYAWLLLSHRAGRVIRELDIGQKQLFSDLWFFCPTTVSDLSPCLTKQIKWKMKDLLHTEIPMCHWYLVLIQFLYKFDLNWTSREVSFELCNVKLKSWDGLEQWRKAKFVETICFIKSPTFLCVSVGCWLGSIMSGTTANANILWRFPAKVPPYYT